MTDDPIQPLPSDDDIRARFERVKRELEAQGITGEIPEDAEVEVDVKLAEMLEGTITSPLPESHDPERSPALKDLDDRIASVRNSLKQGPDSTSVSGGLDRKGAVSTGIGLMLAYTLVGVPLVGYGIGLLLNRATGGQGWHIWTVLGGSVIAIFYTVMVLKQHGDRL